MRPMSVVTVCALALLAAAASVAAVAQEPPPEADAQQAQAQAAAPAPPLDFTAWLGWADWNLDGNTTRFRQYATPPHGIFLPEIMYAPLASPNGYQGSAVLRGIPLDDHLLAGSLDFLWGTSRIEAWRLRNTYFDPTPFVIDESSRQWSSIAFRQILGLDWMLSLNHEMDEQSWSLSLPSTELHQRARYNAATLTGPLGPGYLSLYGTAWRYTDRTLVLPNSDYSRLSAAYLWQALPRLGVEGVYQRAEVRRTGLPNARMDTARIGGDLEAGPSTGVQFALRRDNLHMPQAQGAVVNEHRMGSARLTHRVRGWTFQLGARQREMQRTRDDRTYVDVPRWSAVDARLTGRLTPDLRLTLRGAQEHMTNRAPAGTTDARPLYWSDRVTAQANLQAGWPTASAYLSAGYRRYKNEDRGTRVTNCSALVGGTWDVGPGVSLFAEYGVDQWEGRAENTAFPTLDNFMPDGRVSVVGVNWAIDDRTQFWANFTDYVTDNDNPLRIRDSNIHGRLLNVSVRRQLGAGSQVGLTFSPWTYRDRVTSQMNYETAVLMVTGSGRF